MIDELLVRNLGVIREARLEFGPGLTVVTGETGAGKTLLLGALRMLLGSDARSDLVGPFDDEASVEGRLLVGDGEVAAARRLRRGARSRAYLDGSIASAEALDAATRDTVEIIGQHDQLAITRPAEIRRMLDRALDGEGAVAREAYRDAWLRHTRLLAARDALGGDRPALERERLMAQHDVATISAAAPSLDEETLLRQRLDRLRNAEEIRALANEAAARIDRGRDEAGAAVALMRRMRALDSSTAPALDAVDGVESQLSDAAGALVRLIEDLELDPEELEEAEARQAVLTDLTRRYGPTLTDVLDFCARQRRRADELADLLEGADRIDTDLAAADEDLRQAGRDLRQARQRAGERLAATAVAHLLELGFGRPLLEVRVGESDPGPGGADTSEVVFASDDRLAPGPVSKVASGGELSRLVLALRLAGSADDAASVVFDEIDAGVGGNTALAVGAKLAALATTRQVLCVTHLPQVAAHADAHWVVDRTGEEATVRRVTGDGRIEELTRMLAGLPESSGGREAVRELLARAGKPVDTVRP